MKAAKWAQVAFAVGRPGTDRCPWVSPGTVCDSTAADLTKSLLNDTLSIPFDVVKDYGLPHYADHNTLVIARYNSQSTSIHNIPLFLSK